MPSHKTSLDGEPVGIYNRSNSKKHNYKTSEYSYLHPEGLVDPEIPNDQFTLLALEFGHSLETQEQLMHGEHYNTIMEVPTITIKAHASYCGVLMAEKPKLSNAEATKFTLSTALFTNINVDASVRDNRRGCHSELEYCLNVKSLKSNFISCVFSRISRNVNSAGHERAQWAVKMRFSTMPDSSQFPPLLVKPLASDTCIAFSGI